LPSRCFLWWSEIAARIQNANFEQRQSGMTIIRDLIRNEGPSAFFKVRRVFVSRADWHRRAGTDAQAAQHRTQADLFIRRRPELDVRLFGTVDYFWLGPRPFFGKYV
jgi:hypothetical protein